MARRIDKLQPISLPQFPHNERWRHAPFPEKTHDIFFSGSVAGNSTVRGAGVPEIERLKALGYKVDQPTERLPYEAFMDRMSRSWLSWSPEGMGWDCYRHYEAAIVQSIPVMNHPTILRHAPLLEGHARRLLRRRAGRAGARGGGGARRQGPAAAMATAARDHAFAHHVMKAYCDHILRSALAPAVAGAASLADGRRRPCVRGR